MRPQKAVPVGVEAGDRLIDRVEGVVVSPFPILALVIDYRSLHLHFSEGQVPLEVGHVLQRVPQAKLDQGEQLDGPLPVASVLQGKLVELRVYAQRNEEQQLRGQAVFAAADAAVAQPVAALILVQLRACRLEAG